MNQRKTKKRSESGITLIALIVTIAILVILSAVVISTIGGNKGLIKTSETAAEDYTKGTYEEQLEQKIRATILSYAVEGKEAGLIDIAESLKEETLWVKAVNANTNEDLGNKDILVTTVDGHVYQIYYDNIYGIVYTEYIGEEDGKAYPSIKARYEAESGNILVEAKTEEGSIAKIELISKGEVIGDPIINPEGEVSFNVKTRGTGWYKVRVTTSSGKIRYAWVKKVNISENLTAPEIIIEAEGEEVNGWYGGDKKAVYAVIRTENPYAKEIHYTVAGGEEVVVPVGAEKSTRIQITNTGITRIVGAIEDGKGNSSNYSIRDIKYNNTDPEIKEIKVEGNKGEGEWYTGDVEIKVITETIGASYNYKVTDIANGKSSIIKDWTKVSSTDVPIKLERDGQYKIEIELEDIAGNKSAKREIEIKRDTKAPTLQEAKADPVTIGTDSFKIVAAAGDDTSDISHYDFYINGKAVKTNSKSATYTATGLTKGTEYNAQVIVTDNAGLQTKSVNIPVTTAVASIGGGSSGGDTGDAGGTETITRDDIGKYINYKPDIGTYPKETLDTYSGVTTNEAFITETDLRWKIWEMDTENLYLIADRATGTELTLKGDLGYRNGATLAHEICKACYSNSQLNSDVASIDLGFLALKERMDWGCN